MAAMKGKGVVNRPVPMPANGLPPGVYEGYLEDVCWANEAGVRLETLNGLLQRPTLFPAIWYAHANLLCWI